MTAYLAPQFDTQFFDGSTVAAGYKLYTYESGTTTPKAVYSDQAGAVPHTNPIVLDANGRVTGQMFLGSGEYTFMLKTDADVLVKTWNDVAGSETVNDAAALDAALRSDLASSSSGKGAKLLGVQDASDYFASADAEGVFSEIGVYLSMLSGHADPTGAVDATPYIQSMINAGRRNLPAGTFLIEGTLTGADGLKLYGAGRGKTILKKKAGTSGHILDILGTTAKSNIELSGITFDSNGVDSGVWCEYISDSEFRGCEFKNHTHWGLVIGVQNGLDATIRNFRNKVIGCVFSNSSLTYEHLLVFNAKTTDVYYSYFEVGSNAIGIGIYQNVDGFLCHGSRIFNMKTAAYYSLSCNNITFSHNEIEQTTAGIQGANLSDNGAFGEAFVYNLKLLNNQFIGNDNCGANIGAVIGYEVKGNTFRENKQAGLIVNNGGITVSNPSSRGLIEGNIFWNNNANNIASISAPGLSFQGIGGSMKTKITGNQFYDTRGTPQQLYPIAFVGAFTWSDVQIDDNDLSAYSGALSVGLSGGTLGSNVRLGANNTSLTATLPAGLSGAVYRGSATYDPPSIAAGASATTAVTVTGAALGDLARVSYSQSLGGLVSYCYISAANTVTVVLTNPTGGAIDLPSGTLSVMTERP